MAYKAKAPGAVSEINVTPLVDVMLVLLIIFMVITPMLQKGVSVDLARVNNPRMMNAAEKEDATTLAITRDGTFYMNADKIALDKITTAVKDRVADKLDKTIYIKADARAKYGDVVSVVDAVRAAGVDSLGLLTEKVQTRGGAAAAAAAAGT
jgi:biopolymer transport protein ExbD/biopolymer transport protein TolR